MATRGSARTAGAAMRHAGISSDAVAKRTGRGWDEWFELLDRSGAESMEHAAIARRLHSRHGVPGWWAQMITVAFEHARGRRVKHQRPDGFEVTASKTIAASRAQAWQALTDPKRRAKWVAAAKWEVRTEKPPARQRVTWKDGTIVEFHLLAKGPAKCQFVVQHMKLPDAKTAAWTKQCWVRAVGRLQEQLEA